MYKQKKQNTYQKWQNANKKANANKKWWEAGRP